MEVEIAILNDKTKAILNVEKFKLQTPNPCKVLHELVTGMQFKGQAAQSLRNDRK